MSGPATFSSRNAVPVTFSYKAGWDPQLIWPLQRREKFPLKMMQGFSFVISVIGLSGANSGKDNIDSVILL
jgi:hypothetical protein